MTTRGLQLRTLLRTLSKLTPLARVEANEVGNLSVFTPRSAYLGYIDMTTGKFTSVDGAAPRACTEPPRSRPDHDDLTLGPSRGRMSFALTKQQMYAGDKTVTRRTRWTRLNPGDVLVAVEQAQGLRKGQTQTVIGRIRVTSVRREPLNRMIKDLDYGRREVVLEGFENLTPVEFVRMLCRANRIKANAHVTRIEFEHVG